MIKNTTTNLYINIDTLELKPSKDDNERYMPLTNGIKNAFIYTTLGKSDVKRAIYEMHLEYFCTGNSFWLDSGWGTNQKTYSTLYRQPLSFRLYYGIKKGIKIVEFRFNNIVEKNESTFIHLIKEGLKDKTFFIDTLPKINKAANKAYTIYLNQKDGN